MKKLYILLITLLSLFVVVGCGDYVTEVDNLIDKAEEDLLDSEDQIEFLVKGLEGQFASQWQLMTIRTALMSDALIFTPNIPDATYPSYDEYDQNINMTLANADMAWRDLHRVRWHAESLLDRIERIGAFEDAALKDRALFWGNFAAGFTRLQMTIWWGLNPNEGGGVISSDDEMGSFIGAAEMYPLAIGYLQDAVSHAPDVNSARWVSTVIARLHIAMGNYSSARTAANSGLQQGDEGYYSLHSEQSPNDWFYAMGYGRTQSAMDQRFYDYLVEDPNEGYVRSFASGAYSFGDGTETRLPLLWRDSLDDDEIAAGLQYYIQEKYPDKETPTDFSTWQENLLIQAELDLREGNDASALTRINALRAHYNLDPKAVADMDLLIVERDKTLMLQGLRLVDQRRFGLWHLPDGRQNISHEGWKFFPISEDERERNDNVPIYQN